MDDRFGLGSGDCITNGSSIECVEHNRLGAERAQGFGLLARTAGTDHLAAMFDELRNEWG